MSSRRELPQIMSPAWAFAHRNDVAYSDEWHQSRFIAALPPTDTQAARLVQLRCPYCRSVAALIWMADIEPHGLTAWVEFLRRHEGNVVQPFSALLDGLPSELQITTDCGRDAKCRPSGLTVAELLAATAAARERWRNTPDKSIDVTLRLHQA